MGTNIQEAGEKIAFCLPPCTFYSFPKHMLNISHIPYPEQGTLPVLRKKYDSQLKQAELVQILIT